MKSKSIAMSTLIFVLIVYILMSFIVFGFILYKDYDDYVGFAKINTDYVNEMHRLDLEYGEITPMQYDRYVESYKEGINNYIIGQFLRSPADMPIQLLTLLIDSGSLNQYGFEQDMYQEAWERKKEKLKQYEEKLIVRKEERMKNNDGVKFVA